MRSGIDKKRKSDASRSGPGKQGHLEPGADESRSGDGELLVVQFKGHRKSFYHNRRSVALRVGEYCLVEADRGKDLGRVTYIGPGKQGWWKVADKQGVLSAASSADLARLHENRGDEWEFWDICQEKIQARRLKMDLVTVERQFDHNKITFYFTAEKRVDFRQLVRDLAAIFRTRIELRQIGVRDEARLKGGIGICGREFCCATFLHEFVPVTLKMAKEQQLPLNPNKLSGLCGRLRCCLTYEHIAYQKSLARMPRVGSRVRNDGWSCRVCKLDLLSEKVSIEREEDGELIVCSPDELVWDRREDLPPPQRNEGSPRHRRDPGGKACHGDNRVGRRCPRSRRGRGT